MAGSHLAASDADAKRFANFLKDLPLPPRLADSFRAFLDAAISNGEPLPAVLPRSDNSVRLVWETRRLHLEADIFDDQTMEWFFRDRQSGEIAGTDDEPHAFIPIEFRQRLGRFGGLQPFRSKR